MRILLAVVVLIMGFALIGFWLENQGTRVPVTVLHFAGEVELAWVVFCAFAVGAVLASVIGVIEGTTLRFVNRRLRRDMRKLETEVNYLRTQPRAERTAPAPASPEAKQAARPEPLDGLPSAPVYEPDADGTEDDDSDDGEMYTGGRAV